jgi:hypothetical protein
MNDRLSSTLNAEWRLERSTRRQRQRALPARLRADVTRVRRDDLANTIIDLIEDRVSAMAEVADAVVAVATDVGHRKVALPVFKRIALQTLDRDPSFRGFIRNSIDALMRTAHLLKTDPSAVTSMPKISSAAPTPRNGVLTLRSSIGLGTASYLEAEPEEWCHYVAAHVAGHGLDDNDLTLDASDRRIYVIGAGAGGFARAVAALGLSARVAIEEQDNVLPESTVLPFVTGSRNRRFDRYEAVVMVLPCPARGGAANHRRIYRGTQEEGFDPSAVGPENWEAWCEGWTGALPELMQPGGEAFVLVPASVRTATGYDDERALLDAFLVHSAAAGLEVLEQHLVVEVEPVNQPFVGRGRPQRWSLRLRRAQSSSGSAREP